VSLLLVRLYVSPLTTRVLDPGATALATRLTGFPLALATAGAYIGQSSDECSAQEYLNLYDQQWDELQEHADELLEYENRTLFTTWNLSLDQVRQQHSPAAKLMSFLAYLGNSGLTYDLFRSAKDTGFVFRASWLNDLIGSKVIFNKAMATLQNYSLVEYSPQGYCLHTCVYDWTLKALNNVIVEDYYWDAMLCIATNVMPLDQAYSWQVNNRLLQHADRLWKIRLQIPSKWDHCDENHAFSLERLGSVWQNQGRSKRAEPLYSAALDICRSLFGNNDLRTLSAMVSLASIYGYTNRIIEAEDSYKRVLEICEQTTGSKQNFINRVRHDLALLYRNQGKLAEAEFLLRKALAAQEASFGVENHTVYLIATSLAFVLSRQGKLPEAEELSQRAADGLRGSLGPNHVLTLNAMSCRAEVYLDQHQWEQACMLYTSILEGKNSCYGSNHVQTLDTVRRLAGMYLRQEKLGDLVELADRWGSREITLYWYLSRLGRLSLEKGDQLTAQTAYLKSLHFHRGVLTWPESSFCDMCQPKYYQHITLAMGRFVCMECDDVDLCRRCYEKYQTGEGTVADCIGHKFFELPTQITSV
jgi:tetratricopeptide (TPR) repeat protein